MSTSIEYGSVAIVRLGETVVNHETAVRSQCSFLFYVHTHMPVAVEQ